MRDPIDDPTVECHQGFCSICHKWVDGRFDDIVAFGYQQVDHLDCHGGLQVQQ